MRLAQQGGNIRTRRKSRQRGGVSENQSGHAILPRLGGIRGEELENI
jgi:hypothetical protein